jgi:CPA1 family monovalent cation:H+ antiporter
MPASSAINVVQLFVVLVAAAAGAALIVRRFRVPYTAVLVVAGVAGAMLAPGLRVVIPSEVILAVFLPGLVFESGYRLDIADLRQRTTWAPLLVLTVPGVIFSAAVVALVLQLATGMPFTLGFLVGAMLAATDAAAVIAVVKRLQAPAQLRALIEGESLFNDGTAIVIFAVALTGLSGQFSFVESGVAIVLAVVISMAIGITGGLIASRLMALTSDHLIELSITLVLAYGTYLIADAFHESAIIATVVAAIVLGNYGRRRSMSVRGVDAVDTVWEFVAFLMTALLFLLIGFAISMAEIADALVPIAWGIVAILVARAVLVYIVVGGGSRLLRWRRRRAGLPIGWQHVMLAAGLRGAVSVALALSLPADVPQRELLVQVTFGIVAFTLIVQALSIDFVVEHSLGATTRPTNPD